MWAKYTAYSTYYECGYLVANKVFEIFRSGERFTQDITIMGALYQNERNGGGEFILH